MSVFASLNLLGPTNHLPLSFRRPVRPVRVDPDSFRAQLVPMFPQGAHSVHGRNLRVRLGQFTGREPPGVDVVELRDLRLYSAGGVASDFFSVSLRRSWSRSTRSVAALP